MTDKYLSELAIGFSSDYSRVVRIRFINAFAAVADRLKRAERTISEMLHDLERSEMPSFLKGQIGFRLMNELRQEKPVLATERSTLMDKAQPDPFLN